MSISDIRFTLADSKVILQVMETPAVDVYQSQYQNGFRSSVAAWRDAKVEDLLLVAEHLRSRYPSCQQEKRADVLNYDPYSSTAP